MSPAGEHRRWAVRLPANWSTASHRNRIEERGIKLPICIKKAQLVQIYKDNFHNTNEGDETTYNQPTPDASASAVNARPPPAPPVTRWSIAADLNGIATRARQRHQPTGSNVFLSGGSQILAQASPNNATTTECDLPQPSIASICYESRLLQCGLTTLETRRLRGNQIEVFKIVNMFFKLKEGSRIRGQKAALVKEQCRFDMRKYSFSQRVINEWNKLPNDCVNASSVNMFKNRIDRYLIWAGYT